MADKGLLRNGTVDVIFILRRLQEEYIDKQNKLCMSFVDMKCFFMEFQKR